MKLEGTHWKVDAFGIEHRGDRYDLIDIRAGVTKPRRIEVLGQPTRVVHDYPVHVQISVSPTGRSVQVFVDGEKYTKADQAERTGRIG